ncbi:MAG: DUF3090 domain-containing protein [Dermatophilaceae bacterium]
MSLVSYDPPARFVAGTVGPPGQRTFYLQVVGAGARSTVACEKFQVELLADRINDLLDATATRVQPPPDPDNEPLETPFDEDFRVGTMTLEWDAEHELVHLHCHDRDPEAAGDVEAARAEGLPDEMQTVHIVFPPLIAQEFARRCKALVSAGRPPCPFCGGPLDPDGHICPRANGYRR